MVLLGLTSSAVGILGPDTRRGVIYTRKPI
jgi:hypothetical protein